MSTQFPGHMDVNGGHYMGDPNPQHTYPPATNFIISDEQATAMNERVESEVERRLTIELENRMRAQREEFSHQMAEMRRQFEQMHPHLGPSMPPPAPDIDEEMGGIDEPCKGQYSRQQGSKARRSSSPGKSNRPTKKSKTEIFRMTEDQVPEGAEGTKKAFETHVKLLLSSVLSKQGVIPAPREAHVQFFTVHMKGTMDVDAVDPNTSSTYVQDPITNIKLSDFMPVQPNGRHAKNLQRVPDFYIRYLKLVLSRFAIREFCPDLRLPADHLYNVAHRLAAVKSFREGVIGGAYDYHAPGRSFLDDTAFLYNLYDHQIHHRGKLAFDKYAADPERLEQDIKNNTVLKARSRMSSYRVQYIDKNGYPNRYRTIVASNEATSEDDEAGNIRRKCERSAEAVAFVRALETQRQAFIRTAPLKGRKPARASRRMPEKQEDSIFEMLPSGLPIDYYDPTWYNQQPPALKMLISTPNIAFPPDGKFFSGDAIHLDDDEFEEKNSLWKQQVLRRYELPQEWMVESDNDSEL